MVRIREVLGGRRRLGRAALVVATVAVLAAGAVLAVRDPEDRRSGPEPVTGPHASMTAEQLFAWGEQLPRGDDARVAYVVGGNTLVAGAHRVDLGPGVQAELRAPLPGGWLAQLGGTDELGNWIDVRHGFLAVDGSFRPFSFEAPRGTMLGRVRGEAASPDGSQVAYDGTIVDVASGQAVATLPGKPLVVTAWTDHGVEYAERPALTPEAWQPGDAAPRSYPGADAWEGPDLLVDYGSRCSTRLRLDEAGEPHQVDRSCGEGFPLVSGSGLQVTASGQVLAASGETLADLDLPVDPPTDGLDPPCCSLTWEDDDTLLVSLHLRRQPEIAHLFVRCRLDDGADNGLACERASDVFTGASWPFTQPLPPR